MKVFVVAMDCEADAVVRNFAGAAEETLYGRRVVRGTLCGEETAVVVAGIGKANAAAGAQLALSSLGADTLLNTGVAGGLDPSFEVGDMFCAARAVQHDFDLSIINGTPKGTPNEFQTPFFELRTAGPWPAATVASGDSFVDGAEAVSFIRREFGATVCEMELGAIAHVAARAGVPLLAWKAISDVAGRNTQAEQYKKNLGKCLEILAENTVKMFSAV